MPVMEISIVPVGTRSPSISKFVAMSEKPLRNGAKVKSLITAMGTLVEGKSTGELLDIAEKMHKEAIQAGAKRVLTHIAIDERVDKPGGLNSKVKSVMKKMHAG